MRLVLLLSATVVLTGCASTVRGTAVALPDPPPHQLVFQVETGGGFVPAASYATGRPWLSVYGDGTAFVLVDDDPAAPGTPVALTRARVPRQVVRQVLRDASDTGLFTGRKLDAGTPNVTDLPSTRVTVRPGHDKARSVSAYALQYTEGDDELTVEQRTNRRVLRALIHDVDDAVVRDRAAGTWPPDRVDVTELDVYTRTSDPQPWPGPSLAGVLHATERGRCGVVTGAAARQVFATALARGNLHWREGTIVRALAVRALLPGETGCSR